jgi:hypothetical protein
MRLHGRILSARTQLASVRTHLVLVDALCLRGRALSVRTLDCVRADAPCPCGCSSHPRGCWIASARTHLVCADAGLRPRGRECFIPK